MRFVEMITKVDLDKHSCMVDHTLVDQIEPERLKGKRPQKPKPKRDDRKSVLPFKATPRTVRDYEAGDEVGSAPSKPSKPNEVIHEEVAAFAVPASEPAAG